MFHLGSTFANRDSILSRRDAMLRTVGIALRTLFGAWVVIVGLCMAGVWAPLVLLPLALLAALAAAVLAWRHMSVRILPDAVTALTGRALLGIAIALAACSLVSGAAYELTFRGSVAEWSPQVPMVAGMLAGLSVYGSCMRIVRRRHLDLSDAQERGDVAFVVRVIGDLLAAAARSAKEAWRSPD